MFHGLLWRDARAASKTLRKTLIQAPVLPRTPEECERVVATLFPNADTDANAIAGTTAAPVSPDPHRKPGPLVETADLGGGLRLGQTRAAGWLKKSQPIGLTPAGVLGQVMVCGCTGAGRTESLLALAFEAAQAGKGVLYLDGKGDTSVYSKALAGVSSLQQAGNLRVVNLMLRPPGGQEGQAGKHTHSVDLFHGFDETALSHWLADLPNEAPRDLPVAQMAALVAKLAMAWGHATGRRLTPENLGRLCTAVGLMDYSQAPQRLNLPLDLALQVHNLAYGKTPRPGWAHALALLEASLSPLWRTWGHVFNGPAPEFGMGEIGPGGKGDLRRPGRLFVVVLGPAMEKSAAEAALPMRAITSAFRQSLLAKPRGQDWDSLAVFDEFKHYETASTLAAWSALRGRGCGLVLGTPEAPVVRQQQAWLERGWRAPATHVWMHQCDGHHQSHYDEWLVQQHPGLGIPAQRVLGALNPGQAFLLEGSQATRVEMGYWDVPRPEPSFIPHAPALPETVDYPAPRLANALAFFDSARAAQVLSDRLAQWRSSAARRAPADLPLSWCQETLARMLGFAHWHEACRQLSAGAGKAAKP